MVHKHPVKYSTTVQLAVINLAIADHSTIYPKDLSRPFWQTNTLPATNSLPLAEPHFQVRTASSREGTTLQHLSTTPFLWFFTLLQIGTKTQGAWISSPARRWRTSYPRCGVSISEATELYSRSHPDPSLPMKPFFRKTSRTLAVINGVVWVGL